ncbi:hypothetical protein BBD26_0273 [Lactobacillus delbrueckii subsp. bulgaricus]|nr:hypothetical protein BBD26_0273 [Lactobacillus delbrueckii subsp. bulgaricus]
MALGSPPITDLNSLNYYTESQRQMQEEILLAFSKKSGMIIFVM